MNLLEQPYVVGVDLGQAVDPTAIAVVRAIDIGEARPAIRVGHLERLPLGTPYPAVVRRVASLMASKRLRRRSELVLDYTGVGRPVFDLFEDAGLDPVGVSITGGGDESGDGRIFAVSKLSLVSRLQALLQAGRLKILRTLPEAAALVAELQEFRAEIGEGGRWRFGARSGKHDDLVLALAIAVWHANAGFMGVGTMGAYARALAGSPVPELPSGRSVEHDVLPWHREAVESRAAATAAAALDDGDDLVAFYNEAIRALELPDTAQRCFRCSKPIGSSRITDGEFAWCIGCR